MYVLLVRPQQRKVREQRDLVRRVGVGAEVQTVGGMLARVVAADDEYVHLEVSPGVVVTFVRAAVARIIEPAPEEEPFGESADDGAFHDASLHDLSEGETGGQGHSEEPGATGGATGTEGGRS